MGSGMEVAEQLLRLSPRPDAVLCVNDVIAAGVLLALQREGLHVPDDMAVAGFGNFDFARHLNPALTTVDIPRHGIGRRAAEILLDRVEGKCGPHQLSEVDYDIALRGSTDRQVSHS